MGRLKSFFGIVLDIIIAIIIGVVTCGAVACLFPVLFVIGLLFILWIIVELFVWLITGRFINKI